MRRLAWLLLLLALLAGCWSRREITEVAFAGIMAVDWVEGRYQVTLNMLMPLPAGPGGGGGGARISPATKPIWTIRAAGSSLDEAMGRLDRMSPRRLFLGHVRAVLFGEAMARRGIRPVLDYLVRSVELRPSLWVGVAPGQAGQVLEARPALEAYPANGPLGYHDLVLRRTSQAPALRLVTTVAHMMEEGIDLALPVFRAVSGQENPSPVAVGSEQSTEVLSGGAGIFRGDRLVGWLEPEVTRGLLFVRGEAVSGPVAVPCPGGQGTVVFRLRDNKSRHTVRRQGAGIYARLQVQIAADINEVQCPLGPDSQAAVIRLEQLLADHVFSEAAAALAVSRQTGADIIGLGQSLYRADPQAFRVREARWPEVLARLPVNIEVQARVPRVGQLYDSLRGQPAKTEPEAPPEAPPSDVEVNETD